MSVDLASWKLPWDGGCRCGDVRLRVTAPPLLAMACHCTGCQRMSSSAYSLSLAIPTAGFEVVAGEPVRGGLRGPLHHMFCGACLTWMFTRIPGMDDFINLRPTMLDERGWFAPFIETYTSEKLPWATTPAKHAFEKFPEPQAYPALMREYAERGARPGRP